MKKIASLCRLAYRSFSSLAAPISYTRSMLTRASNATSLPDGASAVWPSATVGLMRGLIGRTIAL